MSAAEKDVPSVSVVMAVYNGEAYLCDTVASILAQTFTDFDYIIVNDGSTDETAHLLETLTDPRIQVLQNDSNQGLAYSLNKGMACARGKYIARIDVGDLAVPERFEKQVDFLERHPKIGILGSACVVIDERGVQRKVTRFPLNDLEIRWTSLLKNPFHHPSVMIRRDVLCQHHLWYDPALQAAQDYELWTRVLECTKGANLDDVLTFYRRSHNSITATQRDLQLANHDRVALRTVRHYLPGFQISQGQVSQLREAFIGGMLEERERKNQCVQLASLYLELFAAFVAGCGEHSAELKALRHRETLRIAFMGVRRPPVCYWPSIVRRAASLYPGSIFPLFRYIFQKHIVKKIQRFVRKRGE